MDKRIFITIIAILTGMTLFAQSPKSFNYQAVLRNTSGNVLDNKNVEIEISILKDTLTSIPVFSEIQNITTNGFGIANLKIGAVNPDDFELIDWASGPYFIQISVNGSVFGTSQLLSVPYALYAGTVGGNMDKDTTNELQDIKFSGTELSITKGSTVDLSSLKDGTGTDDQILFYYDDHYLRITNGNTVNLPFLLSESDGDSENEIQTLSISNDTIILEDGGSVKLPPYINDTDNDTKIQVEESPDEDIVRIDVAGAETLMMNNTTGTVLNLPTSDDSGSMKIKNNNGDVVFGVDGRGLLNGDGSGLSNVKSLANSIGGNQIYRINSNYGSFQAVRTVSFAAPSKGVCFVMASGYVRWESTGWDLLLSGILCDGDPNNSWADEGEWYDNLNILTDYNCADSSDQYTSFAQHRCISVNEGTHSFSLWANKYATSAKVRVDDVNLTVLFFPTGGTGSTVLKSTEIVEPKKNAINFDNSQLRHPDGSRITSQTGNTPEENPPPLNAIKLNEDINTLKSENELLKQRLNSIEKLLTEKGKKE